MLTELFSPDVTAEALRANIVFEGCGSVSAKISGRRGRPPPTIFAYR